MPMRHGSRVCALLGTALGLFAAPQPLDKPNRSVVSECIERTKLERQNCFLDLAVKLREHHDDMKGLSVETVGSEIAYRYSLTQASAFFKCFHGFTQPTLDGGKEFKCRTPSTGVDDLADMVNQVLGLYAQHSWVWQEAAPPERKFWSKLLEDLEKLPKQKSIVRDVCLLWGFGPDCSKKPGEDMIPWARAREQQTCKENASPLAANCWMPLKDAIDENRTLAETASLFAAKMAEQWLAEFELTDTNRREGAFRWLWTAFNLNVRNWTAARQLVPVLLADKDLPAEYRTKAEFIRSEIHNLIDRRNAVRLKRAVTRLGLQQLTSRRSLETRSFTSADLDDAVATLQDLHLLLDCTDEESLSSDDRAILRKLAGRVQFVSERAAAALCEAGVPYNWIPAKDHLSIRPLREGKLLLEGLLPVKSGGELVQVFALRTGETGSSGKKDDNPRQPELLGTRYLPRDSRVFSVSLKRELRAGEDVQLRYPGRDGQADRNFAPSIPVYTAASSWGRMRLYGRMGAEIYGKGLDDHFGVSGGLTFDVAARAITMKSRWGLQFYTEGRLESISTTSLVRLKTAITDPLASKGRKLGSRCSSNTPTCSGPPVRGRVGESGVYLPILLPPRLWGLRLGGTYRGSRIGTFIAPLWKVGTMGRIGEVPNGDFEFKYHGVEVVGRELRPSPYSFRAGGLRVGSLRYFGDGGSRSAKPLLGQTAPILGWHLDITAGRWENFNISPVGTPPWRLEIRGLGQIPGTPWFAGAFVNVGPGPNDYRLFFGMRAEIAQLVTKALGSRKKPSQPGKADIIKVCLNRPCQ